MPLHNLVIDSCPIKRPWNPKFLYEAGHSSKEGKLNSKETESRWRFRTRDPTGTIYEAKGDFPSYITSMQVQVHAIKEACEFIMRSLSSQVDVRIYCMSQIRTL